MEKALFPFWWSSLQIQMSFLFVEQEFLSVSFIVVEPNISAILVWIRVGFLAVASHVCLENSFIGARPLSPYPPPPIRV